MKTLHDETARRRRLGASLLLASVLALGLGSATASAGVQTVSSSGGSYATAMGGGGLDDGWTLSYLAYFAHPEGVTAATPASAGADLARPVGWLMLEKSRRIPGSPSTGYNHEREQLCNSVENVSSYDVGHRIDTGGPHHNEPAWTGLWFDVECDGALGYDFFRVRVDSDGSALRRFATVDTEGPVTVERDPSYGAFISEESAQETAWGEADWIYSRWVTDDEHLPGFEPVSIPRVSHGVSQGVLSMHYQFERNWGWGGPFGQEDYGVVGAQPLEQQMARASVCGYRDGEEVECFSGPGGSAEVVPSTAGMIQTLHSP